MATTWKFYLTSHEAWDAMYADIIAAEHSIEFEQYILQYEPLMTRFFDACMEKARTGVRVRMLLDMVGSFQLYESPAVRDLRDAGVDVRFSHPISLWRLGNLTSLLFRDHRKLLLVDGVIAYTGGVCMFDQSKDWRETTMRIQSPIVEDMQLAFERMWDVASGNKAPRDSKFISRESFQFLTSAPRFRQRRLYRVFFKRLKTARRTIYLTTPYFIPPLRLFRRLRRAARRGMDVRLLVPLVSDSVIVDYASQSFFTLALKSGIKIYRHPAPFIHAKTAVIDNQWATVGSMNLDNRSFKFSYEGNIVTTDPACVAELQQHFFDDIAKSTELHLDVWQKRLFVHKFFEILIWPIHWLL